MIFDTGASASALFERSAQRLGIASEPRAGNGPKERKISEAFDLSMFGQTARVRLPLIPFDTEERVDGVFAWTNLTADLLLIDGYERLVSTPQEIPQSDRWQHWKLDRANSQLFFEVTRDQKAYGRIFLDSGAACGIRVHPDIWKAWKEGHRDAGITLGTFRYALGDTMVHEMSWARKLELGDLVFYDVPVSPLSSEEVRQVGPDYVAMIGILAFRNLRVLLDRKGGRLLTQSIEPAMLHNRLGAVFVRSSTKEDRGLVAHVLPDSPAARAGLQNGDILVTVEGLAVAQEVLVNHQFFQPAGTTVHLKILRNDVPHDFKIELQDMLIAR